MTIRVIAVDDHPLILKAITDLLKDFPDIRMLATTTQGSQMLSLVREHHPDVAIVDLAMAGDAFDPISAVKTLHEQFPDIKVLVLTGYDDGLWVRELVKAGASGYMLKSDDLSLNIPQAIRALQQGLRFFSPGVTDKLIDQDADHLTQRELSVLNLMAKGLSTGAIAQNLGISDKRIRNILVIICDKLGIERTGEFAPRISVINKARELGILPKE